MPLRRPFPYPVNPQNARFNHKIRHQPGTPRPPSPPTLGGTVQHLPQSWGPGGQDLNDYRTAKGKKIVKPSPTLPSHNRRDVLSCNNISTS